MNDLKGDVVTVFKIELVSFYAHAPAHAHTETFADRMQDYSHPVSSQDLGCCLH